MSSSRQLKSVIKKLDKAEVFLKEATLKAVIAEKKFILELNKKQLFDEGVNSNEVPLAGYQSASYARLKSRLNPNNVTDLNLSGTHYKGFTMTKKFPMEIYSTAAVSGKLIGQYGADIYGLTDYSKEIAREQRINDRILKAYTKYIKAI